MNHDNLFEVIPKSIYFSILILVSKSSKCLKRSFRGCFCGEKVCVWGKFVWVSFRVNILVFNLSELSNWTFFPRFKNNQTNQKNNSIKQRSKFSLSFFKNYFWIIYCDWKRVMRPWGNHVIEHFFQETFFFSSSMKTMILYLFVFLLIRFFSKRGKKRKHN